jgi:hypothetical protein
MPGRLWSFWIIPRQTCLVAIKLIDDAAFSVEVVLAAPHEIHQLDVPRHTPAPGLQHAHHL